MNVSVRVRFLAACVLMAVCLATGTGARADDAPLKIATLPIDPTAAIFYAAELGYFKKAGLNVEISSFTNGGASGAALAGGAVDIGLIDLVSMASAHSRGIPLAYLAAGAVYTKDAQTYVIVVPKMSAIKTAKDFAGKTVAVNGLKNINQIPTEAWIDNNGGDSRAVKFIEMPYPAMLAAVENATVDAAAVTEPTLALSNGKFRVINVNEKTVAPSFLVAGYAANVNWIKAHPDLAKKFVAVMAETAKWANSNRSESGAILAKISKLAPDVPPRMIRAYYGESLKASEIQPVIDATAKYGVISKTFPASEIIGADALR